MIVEFRRGFEVKNFLRILILGLLVLPFPGFAMCDIQPETMDELWGEGRSIEIISNNPYAYYTLVDRRQTQSWEGCGQEFTFTGLSARDYTLIFHSDDTEQFIPPESKHITFSQDSINHLTIVAKYKVAGQLAIESNINRFNVKIEPFCSKDRPYIGEVNDHMKTMFLPEGKYLVSFLPIIQGDKTLYSRPIEVRVSCAEEAFAIGEYSTRKH